MNLVIFPLFVYVKLIHPFFLGIGEILYVFSLLNDDTEIKPTLVGHLFFLEAGGGCRGGFVA